MHINKKVFSTFSLSAVLLLPLIACEQKGPDYVIGVVASLTGEDKAGGQSILRAVEMRVAEVNKKGGVQGHKVVVKALDDKGDPNVSKESLLSLEKDPSVLAVIGYSHRYELKDVPQLVLFSRGSAETSLGDRPKHPWVFGLNYSDEYRQRVLAAYIRTFEPTPNVVVINAEGAEAEERIDEFEFLAEEAGLVTRRLNVKSASEVKISQDSSESVVLFAPKKKILELIKAVHTIDPGISIYGDQRVTNVIEKEAKEPLVQNVFGCSPYTYAMARYEATEFRDLYRKLHGQAPAVDGAFAYDAAKLLIDALISKSNPTRESIRAALAKRNSTSTAFSGTTARLYFDKHQFVKRPVIMQHVFDRSLRPAFKQLREIPSSLPRDKEHKIAEVDGRFYYEQSVVYIGMDFLGLESIDSQKKQVDINSLVWMKWQGDFSPESLTLVNDAANSERTKVKHGPFAQEVHELPVKRNPDKKYAPQEVMFAAYKFKLPVRYEFELTEFPFDTQRIPIKLTNQSSDVNRLAFVADSEYIGDKKLEDPNWTQIDRDDYAAYFTQPSSFGTYRNSERSSYQRPNISNYEVHVEVKRAVFGYIFSLFVPIFACLLLCFLAFYIRIDDNASRLAMITASFFVAVLSHIGLRSAVGVSYLVSADLFYFISYGSIIASILSINIIEEIREGDVSKAKTVQRVLRRSIIAATFIVYILYALKMVFL